MSHWEGFFLFEGEVKMLGGSRSRVDRLGLMISAQKVQF